MATGYASFVRVSINEPNVVEMHDRNKLLFNWTVKLLGWSQFIDVLVFVALLIHSCSSSVPTSNTIKITILQVFLAVAIVSTMAYGILLILATYKESVLLIHVALWMCFYLTFVNLVVSLMGIYVYCAGWANTVTFIVMLIYIFILIEISWSLCYDFPTLVIYKQLLNVETVPNEPDNPTPQQPDPIKPTPPQSMVPPAQKEPDGTPQQPNSVKPTPPQSMVPPAQKEPDGTPQQPNLVKPSPPQSMVPPAQKEPDGTPQQPNLVKPSPPQSMVPPAQKEPDGTPQQPNSVKPSPP